MRTEARKWRSVFARCFVGSLCPRLWGCPTGAVFRFLWVLKPALPDWGGISPVGWIVLVYPCYLQDSPLKTLPPSCLLHPLLYCALLVCKRCSGLRGTGYALIIRFLNDNHWW